MNRIPSTEMRLSISVVSVRISGSTSSYASGATSASGICEPGSSASSTEIGGVSATS